MLVGGDIFVIAITGPRSSMFSPTWWINNTAVIPLYPKYAVWLKKTFSMLGFSAVLWCLLCIVARYTHETSSVKKSYDLKTKLLSS